MRPKYPMETPVRLRDAAPVSGGIATFTIEPPNVGEYWELDRIVAQVDTGTTGVLTLYDGDPLPTNIVTGGVAQAGLGLISGAFLPAIPVAPGAFLTARVTGIVGLTQITYGLWYRVIDTAVIEPKTDKVFATLPPDGPPQTLGVEAVPDLDDTDYHTPPLGPNKIDMRDPLPLSVGGDTEDVTYR